MLRALGANHVAAGAHVPLFADAASDMQAPGACNYWQHLDCTGADGRPDFLGNDVDGVCVEASAMRLGQLQCPYPRKPTRDGDVYPLFRRWTGREPDTMGTDTGPAFDDLAQHGYQWSPRELWVPRRYVVAQENQPINLNHVKLAINAFRGVLGSLRLPVGGFDDSRGFIPPSDPNQIEGGHEVLFAGYEGDIIKTYTWGGIYDMPAAWLFQFCDEINAFVSQWCTRDRADNVGVNWDRLLQIANDVA